MDNWDKVQTKYLIELLEKCPCLYDPKHPHFKSKPKRSENYNYILKELKDLRPNITVQCIKRKIKTLQTQLSKERGRASSVNRNGTDDVYKPKLWCYNELMFLVHCNDMVPSTSNNEVPLKRKRIPVEIANSIKKKVKMPENMQKEAISVLEIAKNFAQQSHLQNLGREEEFCRYLCSELKNINLDDTFNYVKMDILKLVSEAIKQEKTFLHQNQHQRCECGGSIRPSASSTPIEMYNENDVKPMLPFEFFQKYKEILDSSTPLSSVSSTSSIGESSLSAVFPTD